MKGKPVIVVLIGVVIGFVSSSFLLQSAAQEQIKQVWEYKVETFRVGDGMENTHTRIINGLASEGWEFVGLVGTGKVERFDYSVGNVLFKRMKKG
jgi:hypothetical protein